MPRILPTIVITFILVAFLGIENVLAQGASPSATLTPTETPTETPTPTEEPSPTPTGEPTPTNEPSPTPTEEPSSEEAENESDGEVLAGATELGDTDSGRQNIKWSIAIFIGLAATLVGIKIARSHVDE